MERLVIDTETGGLRPYEHSLLTVGMVFVDVTPNKVSFLDEKHILIKHDEYNVGKTALRINGINLIEHDKTAIYPDKAIGEINAFVKKHWLHETPILGHNVHFDVSFLNAMCEQWRQKYPFCRTRDDTRYIWEGLKREGLVNPFKNSKLGTLAEHFGVDYSGAHDALADCKITAKCFHEMMKIKDGT